MFGITHWIVLLLTSEGNELEIYLWVKISNFTRTQWASKSQNPDVGTGPGAGRGPLYGRVCVTPMIFYPFDRMYIYVPIFHSFCQGLWNPLTCISHLNLHMEACLRSKLGKACRDKSPADVSPSMVPIHLRFYCVPGSSVLMWLWYGDRGFWLRRREERDWGPLLGRLCHSWLQHKHWTLEKAN